MKTHFFVSPVFSIAFVILSSGCSVKSTSQVTPVSDSVFIVDINAKNSTPEHPVLIELNTGTYTVTVVGISDGGAYDAWKPWFYKAKRKKGEWKRGWMNKYSLSSDEFPEVTYTDGMVYGTPSEALANAANCKFTLRNPGKVNFYIDDSPHYDNEGGISLRIAPAAE